MLVISLRTDDGVDAVLVTKDGPVRIQAIKVWEDKNKVRLAFELPESVTLLRVDRETNEVVGARGHGADQQPQQDLSLSAGVAEATLAITGKDAPATPGACRHDLDVSPSGRFASCRLCGFVGRWRDGAWQRVQQAPCPPLVSRGQGAYARTTSGRDVLQQTAVGGLIDAIV